MLANEWEKVQPVLTFSDNVNIITMKNKEGILRGRVLRMTHIPDRRYSPWTAFCSRTGEIPVPTV